ncbi:MAG: RNase adapter RapZ [Defluviitaleaceae bacterium]|nr:RNase adapter RapZ [Defluviitaleaceae bacterium]MCL2273825.1 RNase adapter RapZ [Defluviitaleaceae bacterium]
MRIVIVTGMSGAGKTTVLKIFEDAGYHCVDNLPPTFIGDFAKLCVERDTGITQVALGIDIRGGKMFDDLAHGLAALDKQDNVTYSILFLDASNDVLINRYKETRHLHPLAKNDLASVGILKERAILEDVKDKATHVIDTSFILPRQLKEKILKIFIDNAEFDNMMINVVSFGYKFGIPEESDLVFDVRFLPNPFYNPELRPLTGLDREVRDYVMSHDVSVRFSESLLVMLRFLIPHYVSEGKNQLIVSIGCTGGRHRSVALANELFNDLNPTNSVVLSHRDIDKDPSRHSGGGYAK